MKTLFKILFSFSVILVSWVGLFAQNASLPKILEQERGELFEYILQNPQLKDLLLANAKAIPEDFDYSSLFTKGTDVLLVGEMHTNSNPRHDVNLIIEQLVQKQVGLTHVTTEFFLSSEQPLLDQFVQGTIDYATLKNNCRVQGHSFIAEIARRNHLKIVGLDLPKAQQNYAWATSKEGLTERNTSWVKTIYNIKEQNPSSKFIVYGGAYHTQYFSKHYETVPQLLNKLGLNTKVVEFISENEPFWSKLNLDNSKDILFIIPNELKKYTLADYIVYSPNPDISNEAKKQIDAYLKTAPTNTPLGLDACFYDPANPVCKVFLQNRRVKK